MRRSSPLLFVLAALAASAVFVVTRDPGEPPPSGVSKGPGPDAADPADAVPLPPPASRDEALPLLLIDEPGHRFAPEPRAFAVSGRVLHRGSGAPIAGLEVVAYADGASLRLGWPAPLAVRDLLSQLVAAHGDGTDGSQGWSVLRDPPLVRAETGADGRFQLDLDVWERVEFRIGRPEQGVAVRGFEARDLSAPLVIRIDDPSRIEGRVLAPGGAPIARARVVLLAGRTLLGHAESDETGRFSIPCLRGEADRIGAFAAAYGFAEAPVDSETRSVELALSPVPAGRVQVVDAATGAPLHGAVARLYAGVHAGDAFGLAPAEPSDPVVLEALGGGAFRLTRAFPGIDPVAVAFSAPGAGETLWIAPDPWPGDETVEVRIGSRRVPGVCVDGVLGAPVQSATVRARAPLAGTGGEEQRVETDDRGRFEVRAEGDVLDLIVEKAGYVQYRERVDLGRPGSLQGEAIVIRLTPCAGLTGVVGSLDPAHVPPFQVTVRALPDGGAPLDWFATPSDRTVETGADGTFSVDDLEPGRKEIEVRAFASPEERGAEPADPEPPRPAAGPVLVRQRLELEPGQQADVRLLIPEPGSMARLHGQVVGLPQELEWEGTANWSDLNVGGQLTRTRSAEILPSGEFDFGPVEALGSEMGSLDIELRIPEKGLDYLHIVPDLIALVPGEDRFVVVRLGPLGMLRVEAVDGSSGRPIDGVCDVSIDSADGSSRGLRLRNGTGEALLAAGRFVLLLCPDAYEATARVVDVPQGFVPREVCLVVRRRQGPARVRAFVDRTGAPLAQHWIAFQEMEVDGVSLPDGALPTLYLDEDGRADLEWIPPGVYPADVLKPPSTRYPNRIIDLTGVDPVVVEVEVGSGAVPSDAKERDRGDS